MRACVSVEDPLHSDSLLLRNMLVRTYMQDLKDVTQETHYENYRAERIHKMTQMERNHRYGEGGSSSTLARATD